MLVQISSFVVMEATDHTAAFQVFLDASGFDALPAAEIDVKEI